MCTCPICTVNSAEATHSTINIVLAHGWNDLDASITDSNSAFVDVVKSSEKQTQTTLHSAATSPVVLNGLPPRAALKATRGSLVRNYPEIGSDTKLNSRSSAKLEFTHGVRELFGHPAYTGSISHKSAFRDEREALELKKWQPAMTKQFLRFARLQVQPRRQSLELPLSVTIELRTRW